MPQSYTALYTHFIFSTKDRLPQIDADLQPRLYEYMGGLCKNRDSQLLAAGGVSDHVHLLISMSKEWAPSPFMREIKANSSKWIHDTFPERQKFAWQTGFGAFTVSYSSIDKTKDYLAGQEKHHHKKTFQEELLTILKFHKVQYDERYIWA